MWCWRQVFVLRVLPCRGHACAYPSPCYCGLLRGGAAAPSWCRPCGRFPWAPQCSPFRRSFERPLHGVLSVSRRAREALHSGIASIVFVNNMALCSPGKEEREMGLLWGGRHMHLQSRYYAFGPCCATFVQPSDKSWQQVTLRRCRSKGIAWLQQSNILGSQSCGLRLLGPGCTLL